LSRADQSGTALTPDPTATGKSMWNADPPSRDRSTHTVPLSVDEVRHDREPETRPESLRFRAEEWLEDAFRLLCGYSASRICHHDVHHLCRRAHALEPRGHPGNVRPRANRERGIIGPTHDPVLARGAWKPVGVHGDGSSWRRSRLTGLPSHARCRPREPASRGEALEPHALRSLLAKLLERVRSDPAIVPNSAGPSEATSEGLPRVIASAASASASTGATTPRRGLYATAPARTATTPSSSIESGSNADGTSPTPAAKRSRPSPATAVTVAASTSAPRDSARSAGRDGGPTGATGTLGIPKTRGRRPEGRRPHRHQRDARSNSTTGTSARLQPSPAQPHRHR
jgi:hypothetical protein